MSGFSADWLALREPADHAARDAALLAELAAAFAAQDTVTVVDLGCGAGSNLRATAPALPANQTWRLVDHDPALLATARERLIAWADAADGEGGRLSLRKGDRTLQVSFHQADLAADLEAALGEAPDLVTAAALFDLASPTWIARVAAATAARRATFYTTLTYTGAETWLPPHPLDAAILTAFHAHQGRDKGFGPAAGPSATVVLEAVFREAGYRVRTADSPWRLGPDQAALRAELARGLAAAAAETGQVSPAEATSWRDARLNAVSCTVGHADLLAIPI